MAKSVSMRQNWRLRPSRPSDIDRLYEVWYASVLATHTFLAESDLKEICVLVRRDYLPNHKFTVAVDNDDRAIGFMRLEGDEIDSLFAAPLVPLAGAWTEISGEGGFAIGEARSGS